MEFGIFHEFLSIKAASQAAAFAESFAQGTPDMVAGRIAELRETAGIDGVSAEINPGSHLSHAQVLRSLQLYCQEVMPRFK
jgi:hypothetical protein